ncbi:ABC transporter permease [archaeon]|jgi:putative ABC transport system permease protein|nr:ABC transporter permease [archaeon]MBT4022843.1 ABC transporter permease [archaeon]MBT4272963.1 ABC transporter permease [archaeon]MBT4460946.1 ABC transporter permease [archaeon]MBT4858026.1 ABC transporter permease [archaeon]
MLKEYFNLAFVNISSRKLRSWLTMIGIFIGIASVIALMGLGSGLRVAIISQFDFLGSDILSVQASGIAFGPPGSGVVTPLSDELIEKIAKVDGVESTYNRWIESAIFEFNSIQSLLLVTSTPEGDKRRMFETMLNFKVKEGRMLRDSDTYKIVVGGNYAENEDTEEKTVFKRPIHVGDTVYIDEIKFEVAGVLEKKGNFMLDGAIILNENILLDIFGDDGTTDLIAVKVRNEKEMAKTKENLEKLLRKERDVDIGEEDFEVSSPQNILNALDSTLAGINIFVAVIAGISLLVGGIGIMNTMYTSVLERTKEVGIMKAIGAKNSTIFTLFFIESGFLGMVGGLIGVLIGLVLAYGGAFIGRLVLGVNLIQANVSLSLIIGTLVFSFVLGTLFGVMPAMKAAKLQPVDSLRSK